jgi:hypothetical protein
MQFPDDLIQVSLNLLQVAKNGKFAKTFKHYFQNLPFDTLKEQLNTQERKLAFWINFYNAFVQILLKESPSLYRNPEGFYKKKQIPMAGKKLSLFDIEQYMIRRTENGLQNRLMSKFFKQLRADKADPFVHFSLNAANASSPVIYYYNPDTLAEQFQDAGKAFLQSEVSYQPNNQTVMLPALLETYRKDFGGKKGLTELMKSLGFVPQDVQKVKLRFKKHDDTIKLNHFCDIIPLEEE